MPLSSFRTNLVGIGLLILFQPDPLLAQPGQAEAENRFGSALATCDFNGDLFGDVAIGIPGKRVDWVAGGGQVLTLFGGVDGLSLVVGKSDWLFEDNMRLLGDAEVEGGLGQALVAGDFDQDSYCDLVIGSPERNSPINTADVGALHVVPGGVPMFDFDRASYWHQGSDGMQSESEPGDLFADAMAVGDFNGDNFEDLAIGVPSEDDLAGKNQGIIQIMMGGGVGLRPEQGIQVWTLSAMTDEAVSEPGDRIGKALAAGDFNGDGTDDLAVGMPYKTVSNVENAGAVLVLFGGDSGLMAEGSMYIHQGMEGLPGTLAQSDHFGWSLAAGHFDGNDYEDLAIGVVGDSLTGGIHVLSGTEQGLDLSESAYWGPSFEAFEGNTLTPFALGYSMTAGDLDGDELDDLVVGAPETTIEVTEDAGMALVLLGSEAGLGTEEAHILAQGIHPNAGLPRSGEQFGYALAIGDFDRDSLGDLVVGVPNEAVGDSLASGVVQVYWGATKGPAEGQVQTFTQEGHFSVATEQRYPEFPSSSILTLYPNPINTRARFTLALDAVKWIRVSIVDVLGRQRRVLMERTLSSGTHVFEFTREDLAPGVYFLLVEKPSGMERRSFIIR